MQQCSHALQCSAESRKDCLEGKGGGGIGAIEFIGPWLSKNTLCLPEQTLYKQAKPTAVSQPRVAMSVRGGDHVLWSTVCVCMCGTLANLNVIHSNLQ